MFDIDFYRLPNGTAPVEEFLDTLTVKMRNKALDSLLILEEFSIFSMQIIRLSLRTDLSRRPRKRQGPS